MIGSERGGIVGGWLLKIVLAFVIFALAVFEAGSIILARVEVDRAAIEASQEAGLECGRSGSSAKAREAAQTVAARHEAHVIGAVHCDTHAGLVSVTLERPAKTILIGHIPGLKRFGLAHATHLGRIR
jgi:hypothetical protein